MSDFEHEIEEEDEVTSEEAAPSSPQPKLAVKLEDELEKSDIHELGWKHRDDTNDVKEDLVQLERIDPQAALELMDIYAPEQEHTSFQNKKPDTEDQDQEKKKDGELKQGVKASEEEESLSESQRVVVEVLRKMMRERGDSEEAIEVLSRKAIELIRTDYPNQEPVLKMYEKPIANEQKNVIQQEVQEESRTLQKSRGRC
jgi:hypothetical protein